MKIIYFFIAFLLLRLSAFSQFKNIEKDTIALGEVVVSSSRTLKKLKDVSITTTIIRQNDIKKANITNFKDFFESELSSVDFTNKAGASQINMLGFGGKYILFLIDGQKIAGETFDNIDYNRINLSNIQRIEITKGASSSLYGSNAIGGVINIITKEPKKNLETELGSRYESQYNEHYHTIRIASSQNWGKINLSASYRKRDPYTITDSEAPKKIFQNGSIEQLPKEQTNMAGYTDYGVNPKISLNLSQNSNLEINSSLYYKERNTGELNARSIAQYYDTSNSLKFSQNFSNGQSLSISAGMGLYQKYDMYPLLNSRDKNYENSIYNASAIYNTKIASKHNIIFGSEFFSDELLSFMFEKAGTYSKKNAQTASLFSQQDWALSKKFTLVSGIRWDYHSEFNSHLTARLLGAFKANKHLNIRGGYSGGFRSPTLKELYTNWFHPYGGGFQIIGNKNLKVEKSNNFNLSAEYNYNRFQATALVQYSHIKNKIYTHWKNNDEVKYENIGDAKIISSELSASYSFPFGLSLKASHSFTKDTDKVQQEFRPHIFTLKTEYSPKFISQKYSPTISFSSKFYSPLTIYDYDDNELLYSTTYEKYSISRLYVSIPLPYKFFINAGVNNIFNYKPNFGSFYSSVSIGRTYFAGLNLEF